MEKRTTRGKSDGECNFYRAFGHCAASGGGDNCDYRHEGDVAKQVYFYGKIDEIVGNKFFVDQPDGRKSVFYVAKGLWHTAGAEKGNHVIFQASAIDYKGYDRDLFGAKWGRVVAKIPIAGTTPGWIESRKEQVFQAEVYTIDPEGTRYQDDACSLEDCKENGCNIIGVHISALALQGICQIDGSRIPCYPTGYFKETAFSLTKGKVVPALSIYFHTKCDKVTGPVLTIVSVKDNYSYSDFETFEEHLLSNRFSNISLLDKSKHMYITRYPKSWRHRFVLQEMMIAFQLHVQLKPAEQKQPNFITRDWTSWVMDKEGELVPEGTEEVTVSKKVHDKFVEEATKNNPDHSDILAFVAAGLRSARRKNNDKSLHVPKHNRYDVRTSESPSVGSIVIPCTSPLRKLHDYVNQQILINGMFGNPPLYSEEDLWGILVIRFSTPSLLTAIVAEMHENHFKILFPDVLQEISPMISKIAYATFQEHSTMQNRKVKIKFSNASWKKVDYYNKNLVHVSAEAFESFLRKMREYESGPFEENTADGLVEEKSPYQDDSDGILLVLQTGAELLLQISNKDAHDENAIGLRLLKIGKGCHFCIAHFHRPDLTFRSERADIDELISSETITGLKDATVEQKLAESFTLDDVTIKWPKYNDEKKDRCYYACGVFSTIENIAKRDLLCIRKEMSNDDGEYVWCCHGVVCNVERHRVAFKVCSLMQSDQYPGQENFLVEIVKRQVTVIE